MSTSLSESTRENVNLSNIEHENVGEWFEFLRRISFVNIVIEERLPTSATLEIF